MTIEPYEAPPTPVLQDPTGGRLVAWAEAASAANRLAGALAKTDFVPAAFKGNPANATAAIIMGDELGLSPLASLRSIYIVHGTPALSARAMVALTLAHGHQVYTEKSTATEVVVCGRRRGAEHVERSSWTIARAQKAGYTKNAKYATNPEEMLYSKAAGEVCRKVAADALVGIPYTVEDLELEPAKGETTVAPADPVRVQRRSGRPVVDAVPPDSTDPVPPDSTEPVLVEDPPDWPDTTTTGEETT